MRLTIGYREYNNKRAENNNFTQRVQHIFALHCKFMKLKFKSNFYNIFFDYDTLLYKTEKTGSEPVFSYISVIM